MIDAVRALVATPVRQFQVVGVACLAVVVWLGFAVRVFESSLPRGGLAETFADLTAGETSTRWASFYVYLVTWGAIVVISVLAVWAAALAVQSLAGEWRDAAARRAPRDDDSYVPAVFMFWGSLVLAALTYNVSRAAAPVTPSPVWDDTHGAALPALVLWLLIALVTAGAAPLRMLRRRGGERERERLRAEGRARAAERRAATKQTRRLGRDER